MIPLVAVLLILFSKNVYSQEIEPSLIDQGGICIVKLKNSVTQDSYICFLDQDELITGNVHIPSERCSKNCSFWDFYNNSTQVVRANTVLHKSNQNEFTILLINAPGIHFEVSLSIDQNFKYVDAMFVSLDTIAREIDAALAVAMQGHPQDAQEAAAEEETETSSSFIRELEFESYPDEIPSNMIKRSPIATQYAYQIYALGLYHYYLLTDYVDSWIKTVKSYIKNTK